MPQLVHEIRNRFNDIIGEPPGWIIQGGATVILIVWLMVIGISIKLPVSEVASSSIEIIPDVHTMVIINTVDSAFITFSKVSNHDRVNKGEVLFNLKSKKNQVMRSPKSGYISFERYHSSEQILMKGDTIATITEPQSVFYGYTKLSKEQGKSIHKGDEVNISILGYPATEYGYLVGTVNEVLDKEYGQKCYIQIKIPGKLITTFNKAISVNAIITGRSNFVLQGNNIFRHLNF